MANLKLEIFTPKKQFFSGEVESLVVEALDGQRGILAGHTPMTVALKAGELKLKINGVWKSAYNSDGFIEVRPDEALIFSHGCEWPEDIDEARTLAEKEKAEEVLRNTQSLTEHRMAEVALQRISAMLSIKHNSSIKYD